MWLTSPMGNPNGLESIIPVIFVQIPHKTLLRSGSERLRRRTRKRKRRRTLVLRMPMEVLEQDKLLRTMGQLP